jgi:signal transduction histidine kinase
MTETTARASEVARLIGEAGERGWPRERAAGIASSEPTLYAAWREKSARLDRTIETLERISAALCLTPQDPRALCEAVVEAAAHHFNARWAAMTFGDGPDGHDLPPLILRSGKGVARAGADAPPALRTLASRAAAAHGPVVASADDDTATEVSGLEAGPAVAVPMPLRGEPGERAGALAVGLRADAQVEENDLSVMLTLANHAGLVLHDARVFQESERLRERAEAGSRAAERHAIQLRRRNRQLERTRRRLEEARRRQLLGQERSRIARELHDTVAQHLLSIGMTLEWCRKQEVSSSAIVERLMTAKELARSALEEIRAAIYELSSGEQQGDLFAALQELVEELTPTTDLEITLRERGRRRDLPDAAEHALAQIAREALFNVAWHAEASRAWVTVRYGDRSIGLTVADNGRGRPERLQRGLERAAKGGSTYHRGLANIAERARELAARIHFAPRRGGGVRLELTAPLELPPASEQWET